MHIPDALLAFKPEIAPRPWVRPRPSSPTTGSRSPGWIDYADNPRLPRLDRARPRWPFRLRADRRPAGGSACRGASISTKATACASSTLPVRMMAEMGVKTLFLTNAAGGINPDYTPGDFMMLSDHINYLGTNPLIGATAEDGTRFPRHEHGLRRGGCGRGSANGRWGRRSC